MYCMKCGAQNADNSRFCLQCGTPLQVPSYSRAGANVPPAVWTPAVPGLPAQSPARRRPGCVVAFGILLLLGTLLLFLGAIFVLGQSGPAIGMLETLTGSAPRTLAGLVILIQAALGLATALGLFKYKDWARWLVIVLTGLDVLWITYVLLRTGSLLARVGGGLELFILIMLDIGLIVVVAWFATHGQDFD